MIIPILKYLLLRFIDKSLDSSRLKPLFATYFPHDQLLGRSFPPGPLLPHQGTHQWHTWSSHRPPGKRTPHRRICRVPATYPSCTYTYITLHYITLHYITLHYIYIHYLTLHYITLHYITWHYITLHYIHTYIQYIHA